MKVSIISPCLNSEKTILRNLNSVRNQTHSELEHIIIDGDSSDNTLDLIRKNASNEVILKSEKDKGIYDAFNKGLHLATGDIVGILNSDDIYANNGFLNKVEQIFTETNVDSIYGDLVFFDPSNEEQIVRYWKSYDFNLQKIYAGWSPPHPTFFIRRSVMEKHGIYDPTFKISGDYEFMLRLLFKAKISTYYLPEVLVKMQTGGISNASLRNRIKANLEDRKAWKVNGINPKWYTLFMKPIRKLPQFKFLNKPSKKKDNTRYLLE